MRIVQDDDVDQRVKNLNQLGTCKSDDPHIIALAQISGARLLYTNDKALQKDFKRKELIDSPRWKIYSTLKGGNYSPAHKRLLANRNLCSSLS